MKVFTRDATAFKLNVKMSAEAEISNFDTERFIVEVHSRITLWDMTTEAYSNRDLKKSWEELVDIFMNQEEATAAEIGCIKNLRFMAFTQTGEQKH
jgi:DNA mismatch repair protein MutH